MRTEQANWISGESTRSMLNAVAEILVDLRRDGESILIQICDALLHHPAVTDRFFSDYQRMLLESMLVECRDGDSAARPVAHRPTNKVHPGLSWVGTRVGWIFEVWLPCPKCHAVDAYDKLGFPD